MGSPIIIDDRFLRDDNISARYHTHPKNDINYMPSNPDEANTFTLGPNMLFSQTGGILRVYAIWNGKSKLVYSRELS